MPSPPPSLTFTDIPQWAEMVARVTVTDAAIRAVLTLSVTTNVSAQPTFICLCFKEGINRTPVSLLYIHAPLYRDTYASAVCD